MRTFSHRSENIQMCIRDRSNMEMRMMGNTAQPIDNSLETLLNAGNYRDRIRFITVPRIKDVQRRARCV